MTALYLVGGFIALCAVFALIDWLHSRWAWRQSAREVNAMLGQRPPRRLPPSNPPGGYQPIPRPGRVAPPPHDPNGVSGTSDQTFRQEPPMVGKDTK